MKHFFHFSDTNHRLTQQEREYLFSVIEQRGLGLRAYADGIVSPWYAHVGAVVKEIAVASLVVVCVVGAGSVFVPRVLFASAEERVAVAAFLLDREMNPGHNIESQSLTRASLLQFGDQTFLSRALLASFDQAFFDTANVQDIPLAHTVAAFAQLQSGVEESVATQTTHLVVKYLDLRRPLLSLLIDTANQEEQQRIGSESARVVLDSLAGSVATEKRVYLETFVATRADSGADSLLNDLVVAHTIARAPLSQ